MSSEDLRSRNRVSDVAYTKHPKIFIRFRRDYIPDSWTTPLHRAGDRGALSGVYARDIARALVRGGWAIYDAEGDLVPTSLAAGGPPHRESLPKRSLRPAILHPAEPAAPAKLS